MHRERGFTLLELLIALAVAGILVTVAIPDFTAMIRYNRAAAAVNTLTRALNFARDTAITRNRYVTLCRSNDGQHCSNDADWQDGWLIFVNLDQDSPAHVDPGEPVLHVQGPLSAGAHLFSNRTAFTFRPRGARSTNGTLLYCSAADTHDQALIVSVTGRVRVEDASDLTNGMSCSN
ncbi:MAG TPA: GspH/FimT family pseudopilin [Gammaproteobacteria bacterium]|jgi:type IV fimbrial biogenesis protein FimT|nr:GspH/FimT family pseudopilin [Gammaproteobacteria bacterium]